MNQVDTAPLERARAGTAAPDLWYLRPEVKIEPLMCGWPAWPHLLPPLQYAMNLAHRQLPNLKSFVANPWVHVAASSDPSMLGGPFVCLPETQVPAVRELIASTTEACCDLLEIARCFHEFDQKLQGSAKGLSLDDLYSQVPAPLQGFIELTYDINNHPKIRLLEELSYERWSRYTAALQEICIHTTADQDRPFFMSTPLLKADDRVVLRRPFRDPVVDILAAARCRPMSAAEIRCGLPEELSGEANFRRFFTTEPPTRNAPKYAGAGVRIRYFGHACVLVETSQMSVLIDPLTAWQRDDSEATLTFLDLPDYIDYLVLTHGHQDHLVPDVLLQLRGRVGRVFAPRNDGGNIADPSLKLMLKTLGFHQITVMDPLDSVAIPDGSLTSLPFIGEHSGLDVLSKHCLLLKLYDRRLLFMADSDIVDARLFEHLSDALGHIDVVFLGMECHGAPLTWFYGPLLSRQPSRREDESRRLSGSNFERARNAVSRINPSRAYVYAMGQEPWLKGLMGLQYAPDSVQLRESNAFVEDCVARGIEARRLYGCSELVL